MAKFKFQSPILRIEDVGDSEDLDDIRSLIEEKKIKVEPTDYAKVDFPDLVNSKFVDFGAFSKLRELEQNRTVQYEAYDAMTRDIIISSALEMYADDASQYDNTGRLIWCESGDENLSRFVDDLLDDLEIPKKLWVIYYNLAEYGDVYLRLFKKTADIPKELENEYGNNLLKDDLKLREDLNFETPYEMYVDVCDDPECIYDLIKNGKTVQYAYINKEAGKRKQERIELYPPDQFVHIYIENPHIRDRELFEFNTREAGEIDVRRHVYKVRRGKSMLYDIYAVEKEIQLLEDSLLLNRLSRSAITRLFNIEVGDMPDPEVRRVLQRVKNAFEAKLSLNAKTKSIDSYIQSSSLDNVVVSPTRGGQGSINYQTIGGDVDVRSLLDLDYFNDKRFGGLKIPKPFLGFEESLGSNSGETLTRLDIRYGRTIKRLQTCVVRGITDLVNLFLLHSGKAADVNKFEIRVVTPTTTDDLDRDEQLQNKLTMVDSIMTTCDLIDDRIDKAGLLVYLLKNYVNDSRVFDNIDQFMHEPDPEAESGEGEEDDSDFGDWS